MYSVRKTTKEHGSTNFNILILNVIVTSLLVWNFGMDYCVIFFSSSLLHAIIETGLFFGGIRKSEVHLYGKKLPVFADVLLKSFVEGPAFCVPAFFIANQFVIGNLSVAVISSVVLVGSASCYMGIADRKQLKKLKNEEKPIMSRRAMTKPGAVMLLAFINLICVVAILFIPTPDKWHAIVYILSYSGLVMLFYFINYNLGVRMVQLYDPVTKSYSTPGPVFQTAGLAYDSGYEMALLVSPAYWVAYYFGLF